MFLFPPEMMYVLIIDMTIMTHKLWGCLSYGEVLAISHLFDLSSNKTDCLGDRSVTEGNGRFMDYLLWNISFTRIFAGGKRYDNVSYSYNILLHVAFLDGDYSDWCEMVM